MRRVLTRDQLVRVLRSRWLPPAVLLVLVAGTLVVTQASRQALAADTRGATELVSVASNGTPGNSDSSEPAISADGRFVAFSTFAALDDLDRQNDTSGHTESDIYVRDTLAGHTSTTLLTRDHVGDDGGATIDEPTVDNSFTPSMSNSGRYVGFLTSDEGISGRSGPTAMICDRGAPNASGACTSECSYTSLGSSPSDTATKLSGDGRRAAYIHGGRAVVVNLSFNPDGTIIAPTATSFVSPPLPNLTVNGTTFFPNTDSEVALSSDGRWLVRTTEYFDDSEDSIQALMLNDLRTPTAPATRVDFATSATTFVGNENNFLEQPAISGDGSRIAFTEGSLIEATEPPLRVHAINRNTVTGQLISADTVSRNVSNAIVGGEWPAFSTDGRYLAYVTDAPHVHNGFDDTTQDFSCIHQPPLEAHTTKVTRALSTSDGPPMRLAADDTGISHCDVVVRDLVRDAQRAAAGQPLLAAELASPSEQRTCGTLVCEGNDDSIQPALDADGSAVAFASFASDLLAGQGSDGNGREDVFKRTFTPSLSIPTADFGTVPVDDPTGETLAVPVTVTGFGPLHIAPGTTIGGPQGGDYTVASGEDCSNAVLHEPETCLVPVRFAPTAEGPRNGTLSMAPVGGKPVTGQLIGAGGPRRIPNFQAAPNPLDFGPNLVVTPTPSKTVTVTNTGIVNLTISAVALAPPGATSFPGDYTINASNCLAAPIPPAGTCTVSVVFTAQNVGPRPALLVFTDNAAPLSHVVSLNGSGIQPAIVANPPLAPPGAVSQITGTGFPANKPIQLVLDLMPPQNSQPVADANGNFTFPLVIFPHTSPGLRVLHATISAAPQVLPVNIPFLVVPGSLQPPDFAERR